MVHQYHIDQEVRKPWSQLRHRQYTYYCEIWTNIKSQDVTLNARDYINIIKWYEFAFGKGNDQSITDRNTFTKLSAMAMGYAEEMKDIEEGEEEDV